MHHDVSDFKHVACIQNKTIPEQHNYQSCSPQFTFYYHNSFILFLTAMNMFHYQILLYFQLTLFISESGI